MAKKTRQRDGLPPELIRDKTDQRVPLPVHIARIRTAFEYLRDEAAAHGLAPVVDGTDRVIRILDAMPAERPEYDSDSNRQ